MKLRKRTSFILVVTSALVGILILVVNLCACGGGAAQDPRQPPPSMQAAFVYTANGGSDDVTALKENLDTGSLSTVSGSPFHAGNINENVPGVITVTPDGKFLFRGNMTWRYLVCKGKLRLPAASDSRPDV